MHCYLIRLLKKEKPSVALLIFNQFIKTILYLNMFTLNMNYIWFSISDCKISDFMRALFKL